MGRVAGRGRRALLRLELGRHRALVHRVRPARATCGPSRWRSSSTCCGRPSSSCSSPAGAGLRWAGRRRSPPRPPSSTSRCAAGPASRSSSTWAPTRGPAPSSSAPRWPWCGHGSRRGSRMVQGQWRRPPWSASLLVLAWGSWVFDHPVSAARLHLDLGRRLARRGAPGRGLPRRARHRAAPSWGHRWPGTWVAAPTASTSGTTRGSPGSPAWAWPGCRWRSAATGVTRRGLVAARGAPGPGSQTRASRRRGRRTDTGTMALRPALDVGTGASDAAAGPGLSARSVRRLPSRPPPRPPRRRRRSSPTSSTPRSAGTPGGSGSARHSCCCWRSVGIRTSFLVHRHVVLPDLVPRSSDLRSGAARPGASVPNAKEPLPDGKRLLDVGTLSVLPTSSKPPPARLTFGMPQTCTSDMAARDCPSELPPWWARESREAVIARVRHHRRVYETVRRRSERPGESIAESSSRTSTRLPHRTCSLSRRRDGPRGRQAPAHHRARAGERLRRWCRRAGPSARA